MRLICLYLARIRSKVFIDPNTMDVCRLGGAARNNDASTGSLIYKKTIKLGTVEFRPSHVQPHL